MPDMTLDQFADWAERKARELKRLDFSLELKQILGLLTVGVSECFTGSHDPEGRAWPPLELLPRRPLIGRYGQMKRIVLAAHRAAIIEPSRFTVDVESQVAWLHNFGGRGDAPKYRRPQREFLGFSERQLDRAEALIADAVSEAILKD